MKFFKMLLTLSLVFMMTGCFYTKTDLNFPGQKSNKYQEIVLDGTAEEKIVVISINGVINDTPQESIFGSKPGMIQQIVSQLELAENDPMVKGIVLKVDSPGGGVTASDIIYRELKAFRERSGKPIVAVMMNVAASGGYYVSLPSDYIVAHPTTVTGSVGVIMMRPKLHGLMEKIGVGVEVNKSGMKKDMGSPFIPVSEEENTYFQQIADTLADRFISLVKQHRNISDDKLAKIREAGIYLADDAQKIGLVDKVGYIDEALTEAKKRSGAPVDTRIVIYRYARAGHDTVYNNVNASASPSSTPLVSLPFQEMMNFHAGFYYLAPSFVNR